MSAVPVSCFAPTQFRVHSSPPSPGRRLYRTWGRNMWVGCWMWSKKGNCVEKEKYITFWGTKYVSIGLVCSAF